MSDEWHEFTPDLDFFVDELRHATDQLEANRTAILESGTDKIKERYHNLVYTLGESIHSIAHEEPGPKTRILILTLVATQIEELAEQTKTLARTRAANKQQEEKVWMKIVRENSDWHSESGEWIKKKLELKGHTVSKESVNRFKKRLPQK